MALNRLEPIIVPLSASYYYILLNYSILLFFKFAYFRVFSLTLKLRPTWFEFWLIIFQEPK